MIAQVRAARVADAAELSVLRATLWPEGTPDEHAAELRAVIARVEDLVLVAEAEQQIVGFLEARLRSHADGCETSPVGYLEGWFVAEVWRGRGVGRALVEHFEQWAARKGCRELASDTWIDNLGSQRAHARLGFEEMDRIVTYRKPLDPSVSPGPHARRPLDRQ